MSFLGIRGHVDTWYGRALRELPRWTGPRVSLANVCYLAVLALALLAFLLTQFFWLFVWTLQESERWLRDLASCVWCEVTQTPHNWHPFRRKK